MTVNQLDEFIKNKPLRYRIIDSTFVTDKRPGTILDQSPKPGEKVKRNRRIYLTINSMVPPKTKLPDLFSSSLKNAEIQLKNSGLSVGTIKKIPCLGKTVELMKVNGKPIKAGTQLSKGTAVDLIVCDGIGNRRIAVPDVIGQTYNEAITLLRLSDLSVGAIILNEDLDYKEQGYVYRQVPASAEGNSILVGEPVDIFLQKDPVPVEDLFEDEPNGRIIDFSKYKGKKE